jgi:hypothetical protein
VKATRWALACGLLALSFSALSSSLASAAAPWDAARGLLIEGATVVTMDDAHTVIPHGRVLIRDGRVVAVWRGPTPPEGVTVGEASVVHAAPRTCSSRG